MSSLHQALITWLGAWMLLLGYSSCTYNYICPDNYPCDEDTTAVGQPCDSNLIYFEKDVLPILVSNCALSGCHDDASAEDGVILTSFDRVVQTGDVRPGNPGGSDLFEVLLETDPDKRMPPPPRNPLTGSQIDLIRSWIEEGAQNLKCDPGGGGGCDTENVSYAGFIQPTLQTYCLGCHSSSAPSGGITLSSIADVRRAQSGNLLLGAIRHEAGISPMPQNGAKLDPCTIAKFQAWVNDGMKDN